MKYYKYTYPMGDTEYYRVGDDEMKLQVRTGRVDCIGVSSAGPSLAWLEKNATECEASELVSHYDRILSLIGSINLKAQLFHEKAK